MLLMMICKGQIMNFYASSGPEMLTKAMQLEIHVKILEHFFVRQFLNLTTHREG
jgi:hypothetical protein